MPLFGVGYGLYDEKGHWGKWGGYGVRHCLPTPWVIIYYDISVVGAIRIGGYGFFLLGEHNLGCFRGGGMENGYGRTLPYHTYPGIIVEIWRAFDALITKAKYNCGKSIY